MPDAHKSLATEFKEFILRGNVIDLAVAVVIGGAFGVVVTALVKDLITPLIAAIAGKPNFAALQFTINHSTFLYGDFINAVVAFLSVAAGVFFLVIKPLNLVVARRKRGEEPADEATLSDEAQLLTEIRDLLRSQRPAT